METKKEIDLENLYPKPYCVVDGCLAREVYKQGKPKPEIVQICNFIPFRMAILRFLSFYFTNAKPIPTLAVEIRTMQAKSVKKTMATCRL